MQFSWRKKADIFLSRRWATTRPVGSARLPRWRPEASAHRLRVSVVVRAAAHRAAVVHLVLLEREGPAQLLAGARALELERDPEQVAAHREAGQQRWERR